MSDPQASKAFLVARMRKRLDPLRARLTDSPNMASVLDRAAYSVVFQRAAASADRAMGGIEHHIAMILGGNGEFNSLDDATEYLTQHLKRELVVLLDQRDELARIEPPAPLREFHLLMIDGFNEGVAFILDLPDAIEDTGQDEVVELTVPSTKIHRANQALARNLGIRGIGQSRTRDRSDGVLISLIVTGIICLIWIGSNCIR